MPAITWSNLPQRVIAAKRSGSSVSSETLTRRTPQRGEVAGEALELAAVGGERQLVQRAGSRRAAELPDQPDHVAPDQGLAAGEPELADPETDEGRAEPVELLERQELGLGQERHVLGHAVDAAEVAAVGDRDPDVADGPPEGVDHHRQLAPLPLCRPGVWTVAPKADLDVIPHVGRRGNPVQCRPGRGWPMRTRVPRGHHGRGPARPG